MQRPCGRNFGSLCWVRLGQAGSAVGLLYSGEPAPQSVAGAFPPLTLSFLRGREPPLQEHRQTLAFMWWVLVPPASAFD